MRLGMIAPYPLPVWGWIFYFAISFLNLILYRERGADVGQAVREPCNSSW